MKTKLSPEADMPNVLQLNLVIDFHKVIYFSMLFLILLSCAFLCLVISVLFVDKSLLAMADWLIMTVEGC